MKSLKKKLKYILVASKIGKRPACKLFFLTDRHKKEKFAFHSSLNDILLVKNQQCHIIFMEFYQKSNVSQCHSTILPTYVTTIAHHVASHLSYGQKNLMYH